MRDKRTPKDVCGEATMSGLESKEHNTSFDRVRFFVKVLILQWEREKPLPWVVSNILFSFDTV